MRFTTFFIAFLLIPLTLSAADPSTPLSQADLTFIQKAAIYNLTEVKTAELALQHNLTVDERTYAQDLVRQHRQANEEIMKLAIQKHLTVDETLPSEAQEKLTKLAVYKDPEFNEHFLKDRIDCHQTALRYLEHISADTKDTDVRRFADSGFVAVKQDLETAKRLESRY